MFYALKDVIPDTVIFKTSNIKWVIPTIDKNSSIGEQIKHFRRLANIKHSDLEIKLGIDRGALSRLENNEQKLIDIKFIKRVIDELDIADKLIMNDDYINFLLNNPKDEIRAMRNKLGVTRPVFAKMIDMEPTAIKNWENGRCQITRASYEKLKKCMG